MVKNMFVCAVSVCTMYVQCVYVQCPLFLSGCNEIIIFFRLIFGKYSSDFNKIGPVGTELFHSDGQTDRHGEADGRFSQFCERA
jgi:hypothetical protein